MQHFLTSPIYLAQNWKDFEGNEHIQREQGLATSSALAIYVYSLIYQESHPVSVLSVGFELFFAMLGDFSLLVVFVLNTEAFFKILKRAYKHATKPKKSSMAQ